MEWLNENHSLDSFLSLNSEHFTSIAMNELLIISEALFIYANYFPTQFRIQIRKPKCSLIMKLDIKP